MMLAWSPPLVMMPCTRASGRTCWRMASSETKSWIIALRALTPRHGHDEACEARPKNSHLTLMMPRLGRHTCVPQRPWIIIAASTSLKTPASINRTLPAPPSSAGVPMTWMRPGKGSVRSAAAMAAPVPAVAITLCPHACPMFGSASYSAMIAMVGPGPAPAIVARNAVGSPPTPRSTAAPCLARKSVSQPAALCSSKHSSGWAWIWRLMCSSSSASRSTVSATRVLAWSRGVPGAIALLAPVELVLGRLHAGGLGEEIEGGEGHGLGRGHHACARQRLHRRVREVARVDGHAGGCDGDHWLDGRDHLAHVADVGGAEPIRDGGALGEARGLHVGGEEVEHHATRLHRLVDAVVLGDLEDAAGRFRGAFRGRGHPLEEIPHRVDAGRPHVEDRGG